MAGTLSKKLEDLGDTGSNSTTDSNTSASTTSSDEQSSPQSASGTAHGSSQGPLMLVPAGLFGNIVGSLAGTIGEQVGGWFGHKALGKTVGSATGPLIKHFAPFEILPPEVVAASAGPDGQGAGAEETLVVVPQGFLSGLLGGIGGKVIGGAVGDLFGNKKLGKDIGSATGGAMGAVFGPFTVIPPDATPQSSDTQSAEDNMVLVPAGWLGNLFGGISGGVGQVIGGKTGRTVSQIGGAIGSLVPWQALPSELSPASTGPEGGAATEELIVVPAGWLSNIASTFAGTLGSYAGRKLLGNAQVGKQLGDAAAPLIRMLPFSVIPDELQPQSAGPQGDNPEDKLVLVPAQMLGGLLGCFGGVLSSVTSDLEGAGTGQSTGGKLTSLRPFQVLPDGATT